MENGNKIKCMVTEHYIIQMVKQHIKENGIKINLMVKLNK